MDANKSRWQKGFAALTKFKACEGHCRVPRRYVTRAYKLGQWVSVQRYSKDIMPAKRRRRLRAIGFVWDWHENVWEKDFATLTKFKAREGHCRVPLRTNDGETSESRKFSLTWA